MRKPTSGLILVLLALSIASCEPGKKEAALQEAAPRAPEMIPVDVRLKFSGVIHLVGNAANERQLVIPNLTAAATPHKPYIFVNSDAFASDLPGLPRKQVSTGINFKYKELTDHFTIDVQQSTGWDATANARLYFTEKGDPAEPCPDVDEAPEESLHWLPRLSVVSKTPGAVVHTKFTKADPSATDVIAQLGFKDTSVGGTLSAELSPRLFKFAFRDGGVTTDDHTQAVASFLVYEFRVNLPKDDPWFTLKAVTFKDGNGGGGTPIALGKFKANTGALEIIIGNLVLNDFFTPGSATSHFHLYYGAYDESVVTVTRTTPKRLGEDDMCRDGASVDVECGPDRLH